MAKKKKRKPATKKEPKRSREDLRMDILEHFHPEHMNYGGWSIYLTQEYIPILEEEFKESLAYSIDSKRTLTNVLVRGVNRDKFTNEQTILVLREKAYCYKREIDNLYSGLKNLLEGS